MLGEDIDGDVIAAAEAELIRRDRIELSRAALAAAVGKSLPGGSQGAHLDQELPDLLRRAEQRVDRLGISVVYPALEAELAALNERVGPDEQLPDGLPAHTRAVAVTQAAAAAFTLYVQGLDRPKKAVGDALKKAERFTVDVGQPFLIDLGDRNTDPASKAIAVLTDILQATLLHTHPAHKVRRDRLDRFLGRDPATPLLAESRDELDTKAIKADTSLHDPLGRGGLASVRSRGRTGPMTWLRGQLAVLDQLVDEWIGFRWGPCTDAAERTYHSTDDQDRVLDWVRLQVLDLRKGLGKAGRSTRKQAQIDACNELLTAEGSRLLRQVRAAPLDEAALFVGAAELIGGVVDSGGSRHTVGARIGSGGNAEVYLGTMERSDGSAVPTAVREATFGTATLDSHLKEADLGRRLDHPNVVSVLDVAVVRDRDKGANKVLVIMERADSDCEDLCDPAEDDPMDARVAIASRVAMGCLRGLAYLHEQGWAHCDIKPANLLAFGDEVKLTDFGEVHDLSGPPLSGHIGSPAYSAPELYGPYTSGSICDSWNLGALLFETIDGKSFLVKLLGEGARSSGAARQEDVDALVRPALAPAEDHLPGISALVLALLRVDPTQRLAATQALRYLEAMQRLPASTATLEQRVEAGIAVEEPRTLATEADALEQLLFEVAAVLPEDHPARRRASAALTAARRTVADADGPPPANGWAVPLEQAFPALAARLEAFFGEGDLGRAQERGALAMQGVREWLERAGDRPHPRRFQVERWRDLLERVTSAIDEAGGFGAVIQEVQAAPSDEGMLRLRRCELALETLLKTCNTSETGALHACLQDLAGDLEEAYDATRAGMDAAFDAVAVQAEMEAMLRASPRRYRDRDAALTVRATFEQRFSGQPMQVRACFERATEAALGRRISDATSPIEGFASELFEHRDALLAAFAESDGGKYVIRDVLYGKRDPDGAPAAVQTREPIRYAQDMLEIGQGRTIPVGVQGAQFPLGDLIEFARTGGPDAAELPEPGIALLQRLWRGEGFDQDAYDQAEALIGDDEALKRRFIQQVGTADGNGMMHRRSFAVFTAPDADRITETRRVYLRPVLGRMRAVLGYLVKQVLDRPTAYPGVAYIKAALGDEAGRHDRLVLYLGGLRQTPDADSPFEVAPDVAVARALDGIARIAKGRASWFSPDEAPMQETVAPGISTAAHPDNRDSFNAVMGECIAAALQEATSPKQYRKLLREALEAKGFSPDEAGRRL